jgi:hypothetical protein
MKNITLERPKRLGGKMAKNATKEVRNFLGTAI